MGGLVSLLCLGSERLPMERLRLGLAKDLRLAGGAYYELGFAFGGLGIWTGNGLLWGKKWGKREILGKGRNLSMGSYRHRHALQSNRQRVVTTAGLGLFDHQLRLVGSPKSQHHWAVDCQGQDSTKRDRIYRYGYG